MRNEGKRRERKGVVQLEETFKDHLVQWPDHFRADRKLKKHLSEGFIHRPPEC